MEEFKEQLRQRNQRDQDVSRRLRNGHNTIAQVQFSCALCVVRVLLTVCFSRNDPVGLTKFTRLQALQEQQAAAAAALEALPSVDIVHKSLMNTFQSDMLHMVSASWPFLESRWHN